MESRAPRARQLAAVYDFWGVDHELDRTLPLNNGEEVIVAGAVLARAPWLGRRLAFLRLSDERLCIVRHYNVRRDQALEVPAGALLAVRTTGRWVELRVRTDTDDEVVGLRGWTGRRLASPPLRMDRDTLAGLLGDWLAAHPST